LHRRNGRIDAREDLHRRIGVPLRTVLTSAGIRPEATHVVFTCADDYVERLTLDQALDPATVLVHTMNDAPLTQKHGFPVRLLAAGRYGMKNPKWVVRIDLIAGAIPSYWSQRGWNPDAPVQVFTRIDAPVAPVQARGTTLVGGVAYAGDRGISRVEISADDGATWLPAELEPPLSSTTWVRWVAGWTPSAPGTYALVARAFEADGTPQVAETTTLNPRGSTGYGRRTVLVTP
jgi:DMSO/TMAO reductase YedYZ molybdopterin-dependent catalytic subunit